MKVPRLVLVAAAVASTLAWSVSSAKTPAGKSDRAEEPGVLLKCNEAAPAVPDTTPAIFRRHLEDLADHAKHQKKGAWKP